MKTTTQLSWTTASLLVWLATVPLAEAFYNPNTGRWLNRDPAGEGTEQNLNAFVINSPINKIDAIGLRIVENIQHPEPNVEPTIDDAGGQAIVNGTASYHSESCGELKKQMIYENNQTMTLEIKIRYARGKDPDTTILPGGNRSLRQHELAHVDIARSYFREIDSLLTRRHRRCVCIPCYGAQENYFNARRAVLLTVMAIQNAQLDMDDSEPGSARHESRKTDKALFEGTLTGELIDQDSASNDMLKVCSSSSL